MIQHDDRLESVVDRMFERCIEDKDYKQVCPQSTLNNRLRLSALRSSHVDLM